MPSSPRLSWGYPPENTDPWYQSLVVGLTNQQDASAFSARENSSAILMGGGSLSFTASTGVLTWASDIQILAALTGFYWILPASPPGGGTVTLTDGQVFFVNVTRAPTGNIALAPQAAFQLPNTDTALFLGIRRGTKLYLKNGAVLNDGTPADAIDNP